MTHSLAWCLGLALFELAIIASLVTRLVVRGGVSRPNAKEFPMEIEAAVLGAAAAALVTWVMWGAQRSRERRLLTFDFHRELSSAAFGEVRAKADTFLKKYPTGSFEEITAAHRHLTDGTAELSVNIWVVARFYQRLEIARSHGELDTSLLTELFGDIFYWWYHKHFKQRLVATHPDYETSRAIAGFQKWIEQHATKEQKGRWNSNLEGAA
jgi:hypothetical protein